MKSVIVLLICVILISISVLKEEKQPSVQSITCKDGIDFIYFAPEKASMELENKYCESREVKPK